MYQCPRCDKQFDNYTSLAKHTGRIHQLKGEELYCEVNGIKEKPKCKCGCGEIPKYRGGRGYADYIIGHNSRGEGNPMYGKSHSIETKQSISRTRKEKFASGEYDWITSEKWSDNAKEVWNRPGYFDKMAAARELSGWRDKLSEVMSGDRHPFYGKKRPEHSKLMKTPEMLEKVFRKRSMTDIEQTVAGILDDLDIEYYPQFFLTSDQGNTYSYDFKIKREKIIIEVDGDYWHGNPNTDNHVSFVNKVIENDKLKEDLAISKGYVVIRLWESDIKNNQQTIYDKLRHFCRK